MEILPASCATIMLAVAETTPVIAVICALPFVTAVTSPSVPTLTTLALLLLQVTSALEITLLSRSSTVAEICRVWPMAVSVADCTERVMRDGVWDDFVGLSLPQAINERRARHVDRTNQLRVRGLLITYPW